MTGKNSGGAGGIVAAPTICLWLVVLGSRAQSPDTYITCEMDTIPPSNTTPNPPHPTTPPHPKNQVATNDNELPRMPAVHPGPRTAHLPRALPTAEPPTPDRVNPQPRPNTVTQSADSTAPPSNKPRCPYIY